MANIYFQKRVRGIDVYQVGKQQIWDWCGWSVSGPTYGNHALGCNSYSLAKGMYVVVSQRCIQDAEAQAVRAAGGCIQDSMHGVLQPGNNPYERPQVWDASRSCGGAVDFALEILASDNTELISTHVEVWHIVDDAELWDHWVFNSTCNLQVEQYPDGTVIDHECNVVFDATENSVDLIGCELCNDVEYGPWIRYYLPGLGFKFICECCEPKAKKLGGVYVTQHTERVCRRFGTVPSETLVI